MPAVPTRPSVRGAGPMWLLMAMACSLGDPIANDRDDARDDTSGGTELDTTTTAAAEASTTDPSSSFVDDRDAGVAFECDSFAQDCPAGYKCNGWGNDGGSWNATRCVPVGPDPDDIGQPCTVEGGPTTGLDTCVAGAMCWNVNPETGVGVCFEFCQGSPDSRHCSDPNMRCGGHRDFPLCLPTCCPIEQDCPTGQGCYPHADAFVCGPDASGDLGEFRSPCEFINVCDPGLMCLSAAAMPSCMGSAGCCTPYCTVGSTWWCSLLDPALDCVPWYAPGEAPPGYDLTGVCASVP